MTETEKRYSVPALDKTIMILNALSDADLSISELYHDLKLPKSTTFVILNTLEQHAIIEKTPEGKYKLGSGMFRWCLSYIKSIDMPHIARPYLENLVKGTPYTVHLAVLANQKAVYIDKVEGDGFVRFATSVGQSMPLHASGVGKALALGMTNEEFQAIVREDLESEHPSRAMDKVMEELQFARENGFTIEDEEYEEGIRCIGAPIYNFSGKVAAAISITSTSLNLPAVKFHTVGEHVKETARQISLALGYRK